MPDPRTAPPPRRLPRAVRERQMLDAAVAEFSRSGYHAASMEEIARRAGVSKPMVYLYLGGKEDLFIACLRREGARLLEEIVAAVAPWRPLPPDEQLWRGLRAFFGFVAARRDAWAVLYRQARAQQPFAAELAVMRARMTEVMAGLLRRAASARRARDGIADREIEILALALVGAAESVADRFADEPDGDAEEAATRMVTIGWLGARDLLSGGHWRPGAAEASP